MPPSTRRGYKEVSLSQLRSFCEVCQCGGYAAAARKLMLTSPAVWEQMHGLERHYGVALLERNGPGVRPTVHGLRLLEMIRPHLAGFDSTREILQQEDGALPRQMTLVTNLRVLVEEITRALHLFRLRYPPILVRVQFTGIEEVEPMVAHSEADVAFTLERGPDRPPEATTAYEPACELDYLLITPTRHPLARVQSLHLREIVRHPLILGEPSAYSRHRVQEVLHRYNLAGEVQIVAETSSDEYTLACVRAGMGVGITLGIPQGRLYQGLTARPLRRWFGTARAGFLWKNGIHIPPVQRDLADTIRASVRSTPPGPKRAGDVEPSESES